MKKLLLSAAVLFAGLAAQAQVNGIAAYPIGATAGDAITLIVDPNVTSFCFQNGATIDSVAVLRLHSGISVASTNAKWQHVISASPGDNPDALIGFTQGPDGKWRKTYVPNDYYSQGTDPWDASEGAIDTLCFVINAGRQPNNWNIKVGADASCADVFIPLPIAAPFGITSTKKAANNSFSIGSNVPNPFTGATTIRFSMKKADNVSVKVLNVLGSEVATLVNGRLDAGAQSATWSAAGQPAGVYFYTITAGNVTETRKMVLNR